MSNYAYKDFSRKIIIYAKNCTVSDIGIEYYCPTPNCKAKLTLRSLNGEPNPYFAALKSYPHNPNICTLNKLCGENVNFDVSDFSIESFYNMIISKCRETPTPGNSKTSNPGTQTYLDKINTTAELYYFCKSHDINYTLSNNIQIKDLIADTRTNFLFTKGIFGFKVVETKFHRYIDSLSTIEFNYPIDSSCKNKHRLIINFENYNDYQKISKKIFSKKNYSTACIVILGSWIGNKCIIKHWKQIIVI